MCCQNDSENHLHIFETLSAFYPQFQRFQIGKERFWRIGYPGRLALYVHYQMQLAFTPISCRDERILYQVVLTHCCTTSVQEPRGGAKRGEEEWEVEIHPLFQKMVPEIAQKMQ